MSGAPHWPDGVKEVTVGEMRRLGVDARGRLYWDGVEIEQRVRLTVMQTLVAGVVTVAAILGGVGGLLSGLDSGAHYLCARQIHWLGCPDVRTPAASASATH